MQRVPAETGAAHDITAPTCPPLPGFYKRPGTLVLIPDYTPPTWSSLQLFLHGLDKETEA